MRFIRLSPRLLSPLLALAAIVSVAAPSSAFFRSKMESEPYVADRA